MKLPQPRTRHLLTVVFSAIIIYIPLVLVGYLIYVSRSEIDLLKLNYEEVKKAQDNFSLNLSDELFNEHLVLMEKQMLEYEFVSLEQEMEELKKSPEGSTQYKISQVYELYEDYTAKVNRNSKAKLESGDAATKLEEWGVKLIAQEFDLLIEEIREEINKLDEDYDNYIASLPPPATKAGQGYSFFTVQTEKGSHGIYLIKIPMSEVTVKTVSANSDDCKDDCPTKTLSQYVQENNAYAGMNGSYFCPPDYSTCSDKVNSYDFALYNSNRSKWMNKKALSWDKTGLITFGGGNSTFYKKSNEYGGDGVTAGISNYPSLLKNGEVVVKDGDLTSYQKIKGTRGAIGTGDGLIYLAIITNATMEETAYVMRSIGAKHALNLDGGGSSAMYINGVYMVGPGRSLPNAILLIK